MAGAANHLQTICTATVGGGSDCGHRGWWFRLWLFAVATAIHVKKWCFAITGAAIEQLTMCCSGRASMNCAFFV